MPEDPAPQTEAVEAPAPTTEAPAPAAEAAEEGDAAPADAPPAEEKPADAPSADEKPADAPAAEEKPADAPPAEEKPADAPPADEKPADSPPADEKPADAPPSDEKPADEKPADAPAAEEKEADTPPADEKATDAPPAEEKPADVEADAPAEGAADSAPADDAPPEKTEEQLEKERERVKIAQELAAKEEEAKNANWGGWGALPAELQECGEIERPALPLLDELKKSEDPHDVEGIVGPEGFEYPPLTASGADILKRLWAGELPPNREQTVLTWDKRVKNAKEIGLTIPAPPRVPATAVLNRKAAERKGENSDISKWAVADEPEVEESPELLEFKEKGIVAETVSKMLEKRFEARAIREYKEADRIKEDLFEMGVQFNDQTRQWKAEGAEGVFLGGPEAAAEARRTDKPFEIQDIDLPGTWEDFLALPDPKVLAVGPRGMDGKRAWGAGGQNWGVNTSDEAYQQAMDNCRRQGVNRPKIIYPPLEPGQMKGGKGGDSYGKGGGKGGKGFNSYNNQNDYNNNSNYNNNGNYGNNYNSGGYNNRSGGKGYGQGNNNMGGGNYQNNNYNNGGKGQNWGGQHRGQR